MSWFYHVNQASNPPQQLPDSIPSMATGFSKFRGPTICSSPNTGDFPSVSQGAPSPPSLENLSCASPCAGPGTEPEPISYVTLQEQRCVLSWFQGWNTNHRERFLQDLLGKAVPGKVCTLLDSLGALQVIDKLPNIFECQLRLWTQWFESWSEEERNHFLHILEERDPVYVAHFYRSVAGTAGRD
ncbi:uncharacterized protein C14orf119 homolog [Genypterus blacodes]|uniref:uncharacterized protein C14orf119 homolog n=1 Tax=Genypterus blacodes TaxID=154954 RepID=UPI003F76508D